MISRDYVAGVYSRAADARYQAFRTSLSREMRGASFGANAAVLLMNGVAIVSGIEGARALAAARAEVPPSDHAAACLDCVATGLSQGWDAAVAAERAHLVRLRHTPAARAKLGAFLTKS